MDNDQLMQKRQDILNLLHENVCEVIFTKTDGSERHMACTLLKEYMPEVSAMDVHVPEPKKERKKNNEVISVWDVDAKGWRGFRVDSVQTIVKA